MKARYAHPPYENEPTFLALARKSAPFSCRSKPRRPHGGVAVFPASRRAGITHYTLPSAKCVPKGRCPFGNPGEAATPRVNWVAPAPHFRFGLPPALSPFAASRQIERRQGRTGESRAERCFCDTIKCAFADNERRLDNERK